MGKLSERYLSLRQNYFGQPLTQETQSPDRVPLTQHLLAYHVLIHLVSVLFCTPKHTAAYIYTRGSVHEICAPGGWGGRVGRRVLSVWPAPFHSLGPLSGHP